MKTIIAEKPSVAREIARIVGATKREDTDRADAQSAFLTGMVDLPLRGINFDSTYPHQKNIPAGQTTVGNIWWGMVDSNHRRRCQQIYSLSPLATREIPHIHLELVDGFEPPTC